MEYGNRMNAYEAHCTLLQALACKRQSYSIATDLLTEFMACEIIPVAM